MVRWRWVNFPTNVIDNSRARVLAVGTGEGCLDIFFSRLSFLPHQEMARYRQKYCLKGSLNPETTNQPNPVLSGMIKHQSIAATIFTLVSDKNTCRSIDSDLTTHPTILDSILRRFAVV